MKRIPGSFGTTRSHNRYVGSQKGNSMATLLEIPMQSPIERNFPNEVNVLRAFGIDVPAKFDDVCTIYRSSGFLYPQKSGSLEPFWP
jgi:hypothetical protein